MPLHRKRPEDKTLRWQPRKSVRVHLDDLEEIVTVLRNAAGTVTAETDDFTGTVENASELAEAGRHGQPSVVLSAGAAGRSIRVGLCRPVATVIEPGDDLGLIGAAEKVHELLSLCQTRFGGGRTLLGRNPSPTAHIVYAYRSDAPSWWARNRTAVLVGLATNAVVGSLFFAVGRLVAQ